MTNQTIISMMHVGALLEAIGEMRFINKDRTWLFEAFLLNISSCQSVSHGTVRLMTSNKYDENII